ncbi:hypothetical protein BVRB_3g064620 [Beta vulgaris subsp. vulgaris]|nr:hypothetical protein BVRB_3g064620 [Beta vulgaris subsp. vulgaris]
MERLTCIHQHEIWPSLWNMEFFTRLDVDCGQERARKMKPSCGRVCSFRYFSIFRCSG